MDDDRFVLFLYFGNTLVALSLLALARVIYIIFN